MKQKCLPIWPLLLMVAALTFNSGCSSPSLQKSLVVTGVSTGVALGVYKSPTSRPFISIAGAVICGAAHGTNIAPAAIIADIEKTGVTVKTPEGVLIFNSAFSIYTAAYEEWGDDLKQLETLRNYLEWTCDGITQGLVVSQETVRSKKLKVMVE